MSLDAGRILPAACKNPTAQLLDALNLNTLGAEIDRVLASLVCNCAGAMSISTSLGAEKLRAQVEATCWNFVGPIPIPFTSRP
ncbi:MAG: hypothetical protein R2911_40995 [Caldilineaceae bacterium]